MGSEVKALREGKANLKDSYGRIENGEVWLWNAHISPYDPASQFGHEPTRTRKLLLHREEIERLNGKVKERGLTLVPLRLYFKNGRAKVELALARGQEAARQARRDPRSRAAAGDRAGDVGAATALTRSRSAASCGRRRARRPRAPSATRRSGARRRLRRCPCTGR